MDLSEFDNTEACEKFEVKLFIARMSGRRDVVERTRPPASYKSGGEKGVEQLPTS